MPATPSFQQTTASAQSKMAQSRSSSNTSKADDSGSGAEVPTRRRVQKAPPSARQANTTSNSSKTNPEPRTTLATRRRLSVRDQKAPLGPRPRETSPSKRTTNNASSSHVHSMSSSIDSTNETSRYYGARNNAQSTGSHGSARSSTNEENQTIAGGNEFLAPINFDDFHNSIMSREPSLSHFPLPGHGGTGHESNTSSQKPPGRTARSGSLAQRQNSISRPPNQSNSTMGPPPPPGLRARRQSNVPAPSSNATTTFKPPRKSVGPGTVTFDSAGSGDRRRPSFLKKTSTEGQRQEQTTTSNHTSETGTGADETGANLDTPRVFKAKSLQPPSREPREQLLTPSGGSDHSRSSSINAFRTPGKPTSEEVGTPTSSSKRLSTVPHATGLGARTISPTDARRMKRLSMMPQPPPLPHTPPMQTERVPSRPRSSAQSPSQIPRKSVTPSSSRTTPDPNRKSYSSGISLSSNTSYNSVRNSNGSLQPRFSQSISTSRLPTPKPRIENTISCDEEEVPPVPAIPKAYESPKDDQNATFVSRKSSLPHELGQASASPKPSSESSGNAVSSVVSAAQGPQPPDNQYLNVNAQTKAQHAESVSKKNLQPLKLPPLNLLPLSTPMAAKIEALREKESSAQDAKSYTPPPRQPNAKTPSTPLTASKASFFPQGQDAFNTTQTRSSSSHFALPPESGAARAPSSSSIAGPFDVASRYKMNSPYVSSLPKNSGDYNETRHKASGEYTRSASSKPSGPRPHTQSSTIWATAETQPPLQAPAGPESTLPASSLRQKLNLARKRSNSISQVGPETEPDPAKYDNMPPPRLPASATWSNLASSRASPNSKSSYLKSRRKPSVSAVTNGSQPKGQNTGQEQTPASDSRTSLDSSEVELQPNKSTSSILSPVHKILGTSRSSPSPRLRPQDSNLDADDMKAEDEMRKLGSKRKDFETAAKGLDELRRRASPKDRVTPAQALKMAGLNIFERGEIIDFKDIYFCGTQKAKKHVGDLNSQAANFGYDDERGDYNIVLGDHLAYRYEVIDVLGKGSFGQVVRCIDHRTGALVAVKIIRNKKRFHQQALVEVDILQKLKEWDPDRRHSVINFTQSFYFRGHLCISTELLGMNLYEFIKAHDFRGFSLKLIKRFTKQLLSTLVLLHGRKVIHCDLKPENVLLAHPMHSEIRVIDFGSSCFENEKVYTYIQSRFYRSPEVILGMSYGMPIDMWSLGCILAELYTGYPIFPGENEQEQLACIMEVFGPPEKHLIEKSTRKKLFFDSLGKPRLTVSSKGRRRRPSSKDLRQALKCDDEAFLDFITRCLRWDPARRLKPNEAMNHEFITGAKMSSRPRAHPGTSSSSPGKRMSTAHISAPRPLPDPPASLKPGAGTRNRDPASSSPVKPGPAKRHSTVNGLQSSATAGTKRTSNTTLTGSGLPRVTARSASGKPDLAAAAAATSLKTR